MPGVAQAGQAGGAPPGPPGRGQQLRAAPSVALPAQARRPAHAGGGRRRGAESAARRRRLVSVQASPPFSRSPPVLVGRAAPRFVLLGDGRVSRDGGRGGAAGGQRGARPRGRGFGAEPRGGGLGRAQRGARGAVLPPGRGVRGAGLGRAVGLAGEEQQRRREPGARIFCFQEPAGSPQAASPPRVEGCLCARWRRAGRATAGEVLRESGGSKDPPSRPGAWWAGAPHEASFLWDPERGLVAVAFISVNTTSSRSQVSS